MAKKKASKPNSFTKRPASKEKVEWIKPQAPEFIKLAIGEEIEGTYLGRIQTQYGPSYKFTNGTKTVVLSGNRRQLDDLFDMADAKGWQGSRLIVRRIDNVQSNSGRTVHQYEIGQVQDGKKKQPSPAFGTKKSLDKAVDDDIPF